MKDENRYRPSWSPGFSRLKPGLQLGPRHENRSLTLFEPTFMIERRRYERVNFFCEVTLCVLGGTPVVSRSVDISLGGVGIATQARVEPGQPVMLTFHLQNAQQQEIVEEILGTVVHLRAESDGNILGVEFLQPLDLSRNRELLRRVMAI
jgi:c-di-GMP-binding flagellar brake protein YcgR